MSWIDNDAIRMRWEAKAALRKYPRCKRKQAETAEMRITPSYSGVPGGGTATRTTENVALSSALTDEESNIISAVEFMLHMQKRYYNADARMKMVRLVYWERTHTMQGVAMEVGYNINTVKSWNTEILTAVYVGLRKDSFSNAK